MDTSNTHPYPTRRHLRRACERLTPVVLDFGPSQPRLVSYLCGMEGTGARATILLGPIAADRIPPSARVVVRSTDSEEPLAIESSTIVRLTSDTAAIPLAGATLRRLDQRWRARRTSGHAPLTLMVPVATEDGDVNVFPVVDLSGDWCSVEATHPLPEGASIEPVELVGDRRTLRRCRAVVQETLPWIDARGARRFRCRLLLAPLSGQRCGTPDLVSEPRRIRTILELAAMSHTRVCASSPDGCHISAVLVSSDDDLLELSAEEPLEPGVSLSRLQVTFELFDVAYEMLLRVSSVSRTFISTAYPMSMRRRRVRQERRVSCPPGEVRVCFVNPATGTDCAREVVDLSFAGLCFRRDQEDVLWSDLPLEDARLEWRGRSCALGELVVKGQSGDRAHTALALAPAADKHVLIDLLATLGHPDLGVDHGQDFRGMLDAYRRSGIFHGYMVRNLELVGPAAAHAARLIRRDGPQLTRTLVHEKDGQIDATISVLRAWESGWIVQHFGASSADGFRWSGELQMASLDYLIPRPAGRYVFFFVEVKNRSMNAFYERFFRLTGTSEAIERSTVQLWSLTGDHGAAPLHRSSEWPVRTVRARDEVVVARAGARALGPMTAAALSMVPGELRLPSLGAEFRRIGLERGREVELMYHRRRPAYALLHERCSPGLNLTGKLNATWLVPVHVSAEERRPALQAALARVHEKPPAVLGMDRFLLVPDGTDSDVLREAGWEHRMTVNTYVLNRAGLVRYYDYIADRYGAADLRARRSSASSERDKVAS